MTEFSGDYELGREDALRDVETFTVYDISIDRTRPLTQTDLDMLNNVYSAFGMQREASKALSALTLAVGQGKLSAGDAFELLRPLNDWASAHDR